MSQVYVLYNPISGDGCGKKGLDALRSCFSDSVIHCQDITEVNDYQGLFGQLAGEDIVVICGGDGTLNQFINQTYDIAFSNPLYYYPTGSGNDFLRDLGKSTQDGPIQINDYIHDLPVVCVNGKNYRFLNGVGYGIDGYCCEVGEELRKNGKKPDYTGIAIKGLLFHYKPTNATVVVDGVEHYYRRV